MLQRSNMTINMKKFEYEVIIIEDNINSESLNEYGCQEWELIQIIEYYGNYKAIFKREKL